MQKSETTSTHYIKGGIEYDRVTSVLNIIHSTDLEKFQRAKGFGKADEVYRKASDRGKTFHEYAEMILRDGDIDKDIVKILLNHNEDMYKMVNHLLDWRSKADIKKIIYIEQTFYSKKNFIAGTPDFLYLDSKGNVILPDLKTVVKVLKKHRLQTAAYKYLIEENTKYKVNKRIIIQVRPEGLKVIEYKKHSIDFGLFTMALNLHREFKDE